MTYDIDPGRAATLGLPDLLITVSASTPVGLPICIFPSGWYSHTFTCSVPTQIPPQMSQGSSTDNDPPSEVASLKRWLAILEAQNAELRKQPVVERKLYKKLATWCPSVHKLLTSVAENGKLCHIYSKLNKGANGARADDMTQLKVTIASWLMQLTPSSSPVIHRQDKLGCGLNNDVTGWLICLVDYNWNDLVNYHPDYCVTAYSWPAFLYKDEQYNPQNPMDGLFKETEDQEELSPDNISTQGHPKQ
ncbi:hypothetical protein BDR06DRAFT_970436 [Suillus hirtellus]|nr:hypothetical protein BDR06DRAFT_970436 [Suillus hirtellus]